MRRKNIRLAATVIVCLIGSTSAHALNTEKRDMKNNYIIKYKVTPKAVESFDEMFSEGVIYGRLRSNVFLWDWENEDRGSTKDHSAWGVGGSLIYSTGYLHGFGVTAGMYTTHAINTDNAIDGGGDYGKSGKDTYSRATGSGSHIDVLAVSYLEYKFAQSKIKAGRQIFESTMIRSNDSKMIPNTFEGISLESDDLDDTNLRLAYFTRQKLRDHRDFHSVIAYDDWKTNPDAQDDSGIHKGLSVANIQAVGEDVDPGMLVATAENKSIEGLKLNFDGMYIDGFVSSVIAEANYKIKLGDGWDLTPGVRYIRQRDEGAGKIGGAALSGALGFDKTPTAQALMSYDDPNSVDGGAWMARLKLSKGAGSIMAGYSAVFDKADLIAPWRGFPTGGYTRSMAQFNWEANTKSCMLQGIFDFGKAGMVEGVRAALDYAYMDYEQKKIDAGTVSKTDRGIIHLDVFKTFDSVPNVELKFRMAMVNADASANSDDYNSYDEYRFEVNYFF
ncbi:OprD family outer membrane porin [Campylobacterota bacterium]